MTFHQPKRIIVFFARFFSSNDYLQNLYAESCNAHSTVGLLIIEYDK